MRDGVINRSMQCVRCYLFILNKADKETKATA